MVVMNPESPSQPQPSYPPNPPAAPATYTPAQPLQPLAPLPQSTTPQPLPVDYLNQIAAPMPVKKVSPIVLYGAIAGVIAFMIGAFLLINSLSKPTDFTTQARSLQSRLATLQTVVEQQQKRLQQNQLSSMNSTLKTSILSMNSDLNTILAARGIKSTDATVAATAKKTEQPYLTKLTTKLDDAYLTGTLDRSYASQMAYELTIVKSMMQSLRSSANAKSVNEFYDHNIKTITTAIDEFSKFTSSK